MHRKSGFWIALWVILVVVTGFLAFGYGSHRFGYGPWQGWDRNAGWHHGERHRSSTMPGWYGMGPGMMGAYGGVMPGPGTGFGPDMGFGTAGGGYAMMPWLLSDLTPEQTQKIGQLHDEMAQRSLGTMQQRWRIRAQLNGLYAADKRDWNAIRATSRKLLELQGQQQDAAIDFQQKVDGLLTDAQRKELAAGAGRGYGWMGGPWHDWQDAE
jgi:Spy/CpxP family protein refolding chaperone